MSKKYAIWKRDHYTQVNKWEPGYRRAIDPEYVAMFDEVRKMTISDLLVVEVQGDLKKMRQVQSSVTGSLRRMSKNHNFAIRSSLNIDEKHLVVWKEGKASLQSSIPDRRVPDKRFKEAAS